jgi:hypothetical protein
MALLNNWITQALNKLNCKTQEYNSFQLRQLKLALSIEELIENHISITEESATGFTLQYIYDRIKCGGMLSGTTVAQAEALVQSKKTKIAEVPVIRTHAAGTGHTITASSIHVSFSTTDPAITITAPGRYIISGRIQIRYAGSTFATSREVIAKLRRTNNTAADLPQSSTTIPTGVVTTLTGLLDVVTIPEVVYETTKSDDIIKIFSHVAVLPTAGSLVITEALISAVRI